jgi:hypothetical protein
MCDGEEKETLTNDEKPIGEESRGTGGEGRHVKILMVIWCERKEFRDS